VTTSELIAVWLVRLAGLYLGLGLLFSIVFLVWGIERIDPAARASSRAFRWIVLPGCVALWPLLARRWLAGREAPPVESNAHRRSAATGSGP